MGDGTHVSTEDRARYDLQAEQYAFPYHYVPHFDADGTGVRSRVLEWGLEYLCYHAEIRRMVRAFEPRSVLEVGCGDGSFLNSLDGVECRLGVDVNERAVSLAAAMSRGAEFRAMDAADVPDSFDTVVAIEVLEHIPDEMVPGFVNTLVDRTAPGGNLLVSVPSTVLPLNPKHHRHYDESLLESQFAEQDSRIEIVAMHRVYREPAWLHLYLKATCNRFWFSDWFWLRRRVWNAVMSSCAEASTSDGRHVVMHARRREDR